MEYIAVSYLVRRTERTGALLLLLDDFWALGFLAFFSLAPLRDERDSDLLSFFSLFFTERFLSSDVALSASPLPSPSA